MAGFRTVIFISIVVGGVIILIEVIQGKEKSNPKTLN